MSQTEAGIGNLQEKSPKARMKEVNQVRCTYAWLYTDAMSKGGGWVKRTHAVGMPEGDKGNVCRLKKKAQKFSSCTYGPCVISGEPWIFRCRDTFKRPDHATSELRQLPIFHEVSLSNAAPRGLFALFCPYNIGPCLHCSSRGMSDHLHLTLPQSTTPRPKY